jgi:acyl carrier protein
MNKQDIGQIVRQEVATTCAVPVEEVRDEAPLLEYKLDSVRIFELIVALETHFDIRIADADIEGIRTVGDVIQAIASALPE